LQAHTWLYRVAQKSKPPPKYQKIVSNRIKVCQKDSDFLVKLKK